MLFIVYPGGWQHQQIPVCARQCHHVPGGSQQWEEATRPVPRLQADLPPPRMYKKTIRISLPNKENNETRLHQCCTNHTVESLFLRGIYFCKFCESVSDSQKLNSGSCIFTFKIWIQEHSLQLRPIEAR